jgi:hypothetical protein
MPVPAAPCSRSVQDPGASRRRPATRNSDVGARSRSLEADVTREAGATLMVAGRLAGVAGGGAEFGAEAL